MCLILCAMSNLSRLSLMCVLGLSGAGCAMHLGSDTPVQPPFPPATPEAVIAVSNLISPTVVRVDVAQEAYVEGKRTLRRGIGSGVIFDAQGHVLTNYHVAGRGQEIYVTLFNKERVPATLVGDDHWTDLAVLQLDLAVIKARNITFSYAQLGTSATLLPGQDVMAVGTPFGLARTLTLGVVSNNERTFYPDRMSIDEYETGDFANWIQMDTPINPGNSGGPLVDLTGKIVGINTRGGGQNLNFAVPIDTAKEVVREILASASAKRKGRVERSDLGIDLKPLQDLEAYYNIDINRGVLINSVDGNSPAAKAGAKTQDILLAVNGKPTNVRFPEDLAATRKMIADFPVGSEVRLTLKRGKDTLEVSAATVRLESGVGEEKELKAWGLSVRDVTRAYASDQQLDDDTGVVVTTLSPGYPAAKAELMPGDVIYRVNSQPITDLETLAEIYDKLSAEAKSGPVLLELQRERGRQSAVLRVK